MHFALFRCLSQGTLVKMGVEDPWTYLMRLPHGLHHVHLAHHRKHQLCASVQALLSIALKTSLNIGKDKQYL